MADWRQTEHIAKSRQSDKTGRGSDRGIFQGIIDSTSGESQTAKMQYQGGTRSIPLVMPFETNSAWIRSIPEGGSVALLARRSDNEDVTFIRYLNDRPDLKIAGYAAGTNIYRPLQPGEHEIHSTGMAQSFWGSRPVLEQHAGVIRSWLDQDRLEAGQKAPLHTRILWEHNSNLVGDEERFGVVRRPQVLKASGAFVNAEIAKDLLAAGEAPASPTLTSYNFSDYPYPDFTLPGGVPAAFNVSAAAVAAASEVAGNLTGTFKVRPYAKEYMRVIRNPINIPATKTKMPPPVLVDIREGQVFSDLGVQLASLSQGGYLRARHQYFSCLSTVAVPDATICEINELGDVNWTTALAAVNGWNVTVPLGAYKLKTGTGISMTTGAAIDTKSTLGTTMKAGTSFDLTAVANFSCSTGLNTSFDATGKFTTASKLATTMTANLNFSIESKLVTDVKAGTLLKLEGPQVQIGNSPSTACVLGNQLGAWLNQLCTSVLSAAPALAMGNLGVPTPMNPTLVTAITQLQSQIPSLLSGTITVSP